MFIKQKILDERGFEPRASPMRRERDTPTPHTQGTNVRQVIPHLTTLFNYPQTITALDLVTFKNKKIQKHKILKSNMVKYRRK